MVKLFIQLFLSKTSGGNTNNNNEKGIGFIFLRVHEYLILLTYLCNIIYISHIHIFEICNLSMKNWARLSDKLKKMG